MILYAWVLESNGFCGVVEDWRISLGFELVREGMPGLNCADFANVLPFEDEYHNIRVSVFIFQSESYMEYSEK